MNETIETVVTYLEMTAPPTSPPPPHPSGPHALLRATGMTLPFYRYLYNTVGAPHLWWERRVMSDDDLANMVLVDHVDVHVLYVDGVPAGYFELSLDESKNIMELAYFGLMPEFVGRGYGGYLLRAAIDEAWSRGIKRLWVHTCDMDHPNALPVYQKMGFVPYDQVTREVADPSVMGIF